MELEIAEMQKYIDMAVAFAIEYGFQIIGAIIILLVGFAIARWSGRLVQRIAEKSHLDITLTRFIGNMTKTVVIVFVVIVAMGKFGITIAPFIAALGAVAFGSTFALQGPLSNVGAGLTIILTRPFAVGNTIRVQGVSGVVAEISLTSTHLTTEDGEDVNIPNKHIIGEIVVNSFANRMVETCVGISYQDDPKAAVEIVRKVIEENADIVAEPGPQVGIQAFGESSIDIGVRCWAPTQKYFQVLYTTNLAIHKALVENGITIPFPQRDVHVV